ncbi:hypothetical protein NDU88_002217 [Pleurodeles waltl]|uniref:Uncharacterized protein n=1 Tax=Pleurodeles waltl TaxID=8319 RepID=A0AAV7S9S7_PLEWA|nr:hypothetical protein NDU88_002217 [Pleurodeles waltl]
MEATACCVLTQVAPPSRCCPYHRGGTARAWGPRSILAAEKKRYDENANADREAVRCCQRHVSSRPPRSLSNEAPMLHLGYIALTTAMAGSRHVIISNALLGETVAAQRFKCSPPHLHHGVTEMG